MRYDAARIDELKYSRPEDFPYGDTAPIADFNFIQHALVRLKEDGRAALLTGLRPLTVSGKEGEIRRRLLESDVIEAVITLTENLLPYTNIQSAILLLNKSKSADRRGKIEFVYAADEFEAAGRTRHSPL